MPIRRLLFGLIIIGLGIVLLFQNVLGVDINLWRMIGEFWPVLLIGWGLLILAERGNGAKIGGGIVTLLGIAFLGNNLGWFQFSIGSMLRLFWPLLLIWLGIRFLCGAGTGKTNLAFMGDFDRTQGAWELKSDSFWAIMGGMTLDLRNAAFSEPEIKLTLTAMMGSIEVVVPADCTVICDGTALLGGLQLLEKENGGIIANLHAEQGRVEAGRKLLRLNCLALMGGVEIKTGSR